MEVVIMNRGWVDKQGWIGNWIGLFSGYQNWCD